MLQDQCAPFSRPTVSVITVTDLRSERIGWLERMHASLHDSDCDWTHWVVLDRADPLTLPASVRNCPRVRVLDAVQEGAIGVGGARNVVLYRTTDDWVTQVDDDDVLPPGSLDVRLAAVQPGDGWVGGMLADLIDDRVCAPWVQPAAAGRYAPGDILDVWPDASSMYPYAGGAVLLRREVAAALGGWGTMRCDQDIFLHLTVLTTTSGSFVGDVVFHYRKHPGQTSAGARYRAEVVARRAYMRRRAEDAYRLVHGHPVHARVAGTAASLG